MRNVRRAARFLGGASILLVACAVSVLGCAMTRQTSGAKPSGFLDNHAQLRPGEEGEAQWIYINPATQFSQYDKIMFDPLTVWLDTVSDSSNVSREDLSELLGYLAQVLLNSVQPEYTVVDEAGPGVMKIRVAITEAKGSKVGLDVFTSAIPQLRMISSGIGLASDSVVLVGKAAVEMEALDSLTGERLIAVVDERAGTKSLRGSTRTWGDVKEAFDYWGERLRIRLGELRAAQ